MRTFSGLCIASLLSACIIVPVPVSVPVRADALPLPDASCAAPADLPRINAGIRAATNRFRAGIGRAALSHDSRLDHAAQAHACELAARGGELTHTGANGSNSFQRVQSAGFPARLVAENLAWGRMSAEGVVDAWAGSPGHRANMSHPRVEKIGTGVAQGPRGPVWVQVMAK